MKQKKNIIYGIENPQWWTQEGDAGLHNVYSPVWSSVTGMNKFYPEGGKITICFVIDKTFVWNYEKKDMVRIGKSIVKRALKDNKFIDTLIGKWQEQAKQFYKVIDKLYDTDFKKLNNKKLFLFYEEFRKAYEIEYSLPLLTDHYSKFTEKEIEKRLKALLKKKNLENKYNAYFVALTSTTAMSFANEEELHLLKICYMIKSKANKKLIEKEIVKHVRNFYWIMNNYGYSQFLDRKYFVKEINKKLKEKINIKKEIERIKTIPDNTREKKRAIIKKLEIDKEFIVICDILDRFIHWQDQRKKAVLIANYYIDVFLKEISRRTKIDFWDLKHTLPYEIKDVLFKKKIDKKVIEKRKKHSVIVNVNGKEGIFWGKKSVELYNKMFPKKIDKNVNELKGIGACLGKAIGKVKVITTIKDAHKMEKGDILVANMTRPEYVILMKKAKAIVTDEGGLTSHAAVISRELGIPCVIGTQVATKVLKDGELVEVDADKGVVRKVK